MGGRSTMWHRRGTPGRWLRVGLALAVVAALLAATMSTVSSSICAVSDLGTNDFYRRFKANATDHQCLILGRILTAVVGAAGTAAAVILAQIDDVKSVWDLAIMVTGLISSSVIGLFLLGLVTRKTHEAGALVGAAAGMATIILMKFYCPITFWLYIVIGPLVTICIGVAASLILPGTPHTSDAGLPIQHVALLITSRGHILKHLHIQAQLRYQPLEQGVLLLLELLRLAGLHPAYSFRQRKWPCTEIFLSRAACFAVKLERRWT